MAEDQTHYFSQNPESIVLFWILVGFVTVAVNIIYRYQAYLKLKPKAKKPTKSASISPDELVGLLEDGHVSGDTQGKASHEPVCVSSMTMSNVCSSHAIEHGCEAASLAVVAAVLQRRQNGCPSIQVLSGNASTVVEIELQDGPVSFVSLLKAADEALSKSRSNQQAGGGEEAVSEVTLVWGRRPSAPEQWSITTDEHSRLVVMAGSPIEEKCFQMLFEACASDPEGDVWQMQLYSDNILMKGKKWGTALKDFKKQRNPSDGNLVPVPELLWKSSETVCYQDQAQAVVGSGYSFTYQELQQATNAVALAVKQSTQGKSSKYVVLYMGRSKMLAPSFLGILRAGCTVVPVDIHWPAERAKGVAIDSGAQLVLTDDASSASWEMAGEGCLPSLIVHEELLSGGVDTEQDNFKMVSPDDDAVVLFTSGSTGKPKGIVLSHGYLTALVIGVGETKEMSTQTRTLSYHSPTWMPFLDYLLAPLLQGGCCIFYPENGTHVVKPYELSDYAREHKATLLGFVPAVLDLLLENGLPPTLTTIGIGGAPVPADLCQRVALAHGEGRELLLTVGYSGTEQGDVTNIRMRSLEDVEVAAGTEALMCAGRPHAGQSYAIVDRSMSLVGPGAIGEVMTSGPGLATRYLNMPEQTEEYFAYCKALNGARAAHTGDLAKWTEDGQLRLVGRLGSMVKVRGARVDLGEVETAIATYPEVKACVVVVHDDRLVAYVEPAVPADLRDFCKSKLVAYMVPHIFEGLDELPRLPNGKVNKKALKPPTLQNDGAETVMELDSLGQMRKFSRKEPAEDIILDNVRAILLGIVIMSHTVAIYKEGAQQFSIGHEYELSASGYWFYQLLIKGGWSSLAFLSGFDDTRAEHKGYGLTYRELFFVGLWFTSGFSLTMWYLPAFVMMRLTFVAAHRIGLERTYLLSMALFFIAMPAYVDLYVGLKPVLWSWAQPTICSCFCPFQAWPWAQSVAWYAWGYWVSEGKSPLGNRMVFMPCYFIGLYTGKYLFPLLCKLCNEKSIWRRVLAAAFSLAIYYFMFNQTDHITNTYDDHCASFWEDHSFVWAQLLKNLRYFALNLSMSMLYVIVIVALVPIHLKYLAKVSFFSLLFLPCAKNLGVLDVPSQVMVLQNTLTSLFPRLSPFVVMAWCMYVPFIYELVGGAILLAMVPFVLKGAMRSWEKVLATCS